MSHRSIVRAGKANVLFVAGFLGILLVHIIWEVFNDVPPPWDMAYHQLQGWEYLAAWWDGSFFLRFSELSPQYPPLFYLVEALVLGWFGDTQFLAILSNLPGFFLIAFCTYRIGLRYLEPLPAAAAGLSAIALPMVAWISRDCLLDILLAGCVTAACLLALKSEWFTRGGWTLLFALACCAGMLTKWTFPFYLLAPMVFGFVRSPRRRRSLAFLLAGGILILPVLSIYYQPHLADLLARYPTTEQTGLIPWKPYPRHGEPGLNNLLGWIYYPRVLASYFLHLPLLLLLLGGIWEGARSRFSRVPSKGFLWCWLLGGIAALTLLTPKDPRFAVPLVAPLILLVFIPWQARRHLWKWITVWVAVQFLAVSFWPSSLPSRLVLFERKGGDYQTLQQEWVLFQAHYFEVAGPPRIEAWPYQEILRMLPENATIGFLPDLSRFHPEALRLEMTKSGRTLRIQRLGNSADWARELEAVDYVVSKSGKQGVSFLTQYNTAVMEFLQKESWSTLYSWPLPDGSQATLWERPTTE